MDWTADALGSWAIPCDGWQMEDGSVMQLKLATLRRVEAMAPQIRDGLADGDNTRFAQQLREAWGNVQAAFVTLQELAKL